MITPCPLEWPEINRLIDIMGFSPSQVKEGDIQIMEKTGLIQWYDDDHEEIDKVEGAEEAFLEYVPQARVRNEWRPNPNELLPVEEGAEYYRQHEEQIAAEKEMIRRKIQEEYGY